MTLELSVHDRAVLNCIFNPSLPIGEAYDDADVADLTDDDVDTPEWRASKALEVRAIGMAEEGDHDGAVRLLTECALASPTMASIYNNRAQVLQLMGRPHDAFDDLTKCIRYAVGDEGVRQERTLCAAYCQRGLLHRKYNRTELARVDFERAAEMGSKFAKTQLVEINPYAALCNQMLRKVMDDLQ